MDLPFTVEFKSRFPKVNGRILRSNESLYQAIICLIISSGYKFDPILRPVPSVLRNYHDVSIRCLLLLFHNLVRQIPLLKSVDNLILKNSGFNVSFNKEFQELIRVSFKSDDLINQNDILVPLNMLSTYVENFMSKPLRNKKIIIN